MRAYNEGSGFKKQVKYRGSLWGGLETSTQTIFSFGFFSWIFFLMGIGPCGLVPPPPLQWTSFPPLVTAVLIKTKGAESPGSRRVGVIGALVLILPSKTI